MHALENEMKGLEVEINSFLFKFLLFFSFLLSVMYMYIRMYYVNFIILM